MYDGASHENEDFRFAVYTGSSVPAEPAAGNNGGNNAGGNANQPGNAGSTQPSGNTGSTGDTNTDANATGDDGANPQGTMIASSGRTSTGVAFGVTKTTLQDMPSTEDILKMTAEARAEDTAFNKSLLGYLGTRIGIVLLFFLFLIILTIFGIWLILRHNKKKELENSTKQ